MFDIHEYYIEQELLSRPNSGSDFIELPPESLIEQEVSAVLTSPEKNGYGVLKFKRKKHTVDIFTPALYCPFAGEFTIHPDYFRFLLSVYPDFSDLSSISNLIFRPRFVESGGIQLVALYAPSLESLVLYFSYPHTYSFNSRSFFTSQDMDFDIASITDPHTLGATPANEENILTIPPLFYIIKMVAQSGSSEIDKYLLKLTSSIDSGKLTLLDEISHFYNQYGY